MKKQHTFSRAELRSHGNHQIEIKTRYPLRNESISRYEMNLYLITPHQLGLDGQRYKREDFYRDMKANTRYTINEIPLRDLVSSTASTSPIARIRKILQNPEPLNEAEQQELLYEIRSLSNYFSTQVKYTSRNWKRNVLWKLEEKQELRNNLGDALDDILEFHRVYRKLLKKCRHPKMTPELTRAFNWTDESVSLITERIMLYYWKVTDRFEEYRGLQPRLVEIVQREKEYRSRKQYPSASIDTHAEAREQGLERESLLKKWSQSVLYLTNQDSKMDKGISHVLAGTAAAIAMSIAVLLTFFADTWFHIYSLPWALVIVVSYILKDRIKEILRGMLLRIMPKLIADRSEKLVDQRSKRTVGITRSLVKFIREGDLPPEISQVLDQRQSHLSRTQPEGNVIWYRKSMRLKSEKLLSEHTRVNSITEIIRLSLDQFLELMDNPQKSICKIDTEGNLAQITGHKVYHCDVFIELSDTRQTHKRVFWYDAVLTQKGLLRIEKKNF